MSTSAAVTWSCATPKAYSPIHVTGVIQCIDINLNMPIVTVEQITPELGNRNTGELANQARLSIFGPLRRSPRTYNIIFIIIMVYVFINTFSSIKNSRLPSWIAFYFYRQAFTLYQNSVLEKHLAIL
jgi:hypothetical protein